MTETRAPISSTTTQERIALLNVDTLRRLQVVADVALAHLTLDDLLDELLERVRGLMGADTAAVLLLDEGSNELVARAAKGLEEEVERGVRIPVGKGFAGRIAGEGRPVALPDVEHADVLNPLLREKGIASLLGAPLRVEERIIGVLHVGFLTPRTFDRSDEHLLQLVADRAALAIDHARLYDAEHAARIAAEETAAALWRVQTVTDASLAHLGEQELVNGLLERVRGLMGADTAAVLLLDEGSNELVARAAKGLEEEVERGVRIPVGKGFAGRIARDARPLALRIWSTRTS